MTVLLILVYLAAIVAANLSVAHFGAEASIVNALVLIGLDLTLRDALHDRWRGAQLWPRMVGLVAAGGAVAYLLNPAAGRIALASSVAIMLAGLADAAVYQLMRRAPWLERANASNLVSGAVDSVVFPTIAFGSVLPLIIIGQWAAKVCGGLVWSLILYRAWRR